MFNSRRFEAPAPSKDNYNFVTIHNPACKPAKVCHSQIGGGTVFVNCILVVGRDGKPNEKGKEMISFRAQNKAALRTAIEEKYRASFSSAGTEEETNTVKSATAAKDALRQIREDSVVVTQKMVDEARNRLVRVYGQGAEITLEKCQREAISEAVFNELHRQEAQNFASMVTASHRRLVSEMTDAERAELTRANILAFVQESDWASWFKQPSFGGNNFLGFPDYTNTNYATLVRYCESRGWHAPMFGELDAAMRYLLAHSHFYLQHTYPRTQRDAYRAVRPFTGVIEETPKPVDEHKQAMDSMKGLSARQLKENMQQIRNQNLSDDELRRRGSLLR
jgi:hypothetical protein